MTRILSVAFLASNDRNCLAAMICESLADSIDLYLTDDLILMSLGWFHLLFFCSSEVSSFATTRSLTFNFLLSTRSQPSILDECGLDAETKETLLTHIRRRLMPQAVKARADIEVSCYGYEGIDAVKTALQAGMGLSNDGQQVKINLITPPQYVLTTQSLDKESGLGLLQQAIDEIEKSIKSQGGGFNVIQAVSIEFGFSFESPTGDAYCLRSSARISFWIRLDFNLQKYCPAASSTQFWPALRAALFFDRSVIFQWSFLIMNLGLSLKIALLLGCSLSEYLRT